MILRENMEETSIKKLLVCGLVFFLIFSLNAQSTIVLDQVTVDIQTSTLNVASAVGKIVGSNAECETAQTVTAGMSGFLSKIDIWVGRQSDTTGEMILDVLNANVSPGTGEPLASVFISASLISTGRSMVAIDVRYANIFFNAGDSFAIALRAPSAQTSQIDFSPFHWAAQGPGQYDGGLRFYRNLENGLSWVESNVADQALRTWIEPVPEPATLLLFGLGTLAIRKHRK